MGKQKHNVQKPRANVILAGKRGSRRHSTSSFSEECRRGGNKLSNVRRYTHLSIRKGL